MTTSDVAEARCRLFRDTGSAGPAGVSDIDDVTFAWVPSMISDDLFHTVVDALSHQTDLQVLTAAEIRDLLLHGLADVRARLWARVPEELFQLVVSAVQLQRADERALFSALQLTPETGAPASEAPPSSDQEEPVPETAVPTGRRSPISIAREVMQRICPSHDPLVRARLECAFTEFCERAYGTDRRRRFRFPWVLPFHQRPAAQEATADLSPSFQGYARWLSRHFTKFVRSGSLGATADDWSDLLAEGIAQLWGQFLRVWEMRGDPASLIWDPQWDDEVRKLDAASVQTLARTIAKRRGQTQVTNVDTGAKIAYLNIRKAFQQKHGRPIGEPLQIADGLQLAARAFLAYRRSRLCTAVRQGGTLMMRPPSVTDVVHVWLDGEAAAVHPVWRSRSIDDSTPSGTPYRDGVADDRYTRCVDPDEAEFVDKTLEHVTRSLGELHAMYLQHCVAGMSPRRLWRSPEEFVTSYHLAGAWEIEQIQSELEPVLHAWFARHGLELDLQEMLVPCSVSTRGLWADDPDALLADSTHIKVEYDLDDASGVWNEDPRTQRTVSREEAVEEADRLATIHRARVERWILRYHRFTLRQVTDWLHHAVSTVISADRAEAVCARARAGERMLLILPNDEQRYLIADLMRERLHEQKALSRGELEALDFWWPTVYDQAFRSVVTDMLRYHRRLNDRDREIHTIRRAVDIAYEWSVGWLRGRRASAADTEPVDDAELETTDRFDSREAAAFGMTVVHSDSV